ncbi:hypothetical protein C8Q76DRAFT_487870 [Earliella scabrosa]|nr:hypothetical protein C8Q76DRAFT_487870 [Earliella scabrosa]
MRCAARGVAARFARAGPCGLSRMHRHVHCASEQAIPRPGPFPARAHTLAAPTHAQHARDPVRPRPWSHRQIRTRHRTVLRVTVLGRAHRVGGTARGELPVVSNHGAECGPWSERRIARVFGLPSAHSYWEQYYEDKTPLVRVRGRDSPRVSGLACPPEDITQGVLLDVERVRRASCWRHTAARSGSRSQRDGPRPRPRAAARSPSLDDLQPALRRSHTHARSHSRPQGGDASKNKTTTFLRKHLTRALDACPTVPA